jgi:hypothetical protein
MADFKSQFNPADPTIISGQRAVTDENSTRVKADVSEEIFQYDPNANSLTLLATKLRKRRKVSQYLFHWLEKDRYPRFTTIATGATAAQTATAVVAAGDGSKLYPRAFLLNHNTGERMLVSSVSTDTPTLIRGIGDEGAFPITVGDKIEIIGSAYEEGADVGSSRTVQTRNVEQFTQIIRTPIEFTGRDENTDMYGGNDKMTERKWVAVEHAISVEKNFWWGRKHSAVLTGDDKFTTFMNGVDAYTDANEWDLNGVPFTERSFTEYLEYAMRHGKGGKMGRRQKFLFCAPRFVTELESMARDRMQVLPSSEVFGLEVTAFKSSHGKVMLIEHPLFEEQGDIAFLLDMNHVKYVYHQGRDTKLLENRGGNGVDGTTEEYLSDVAIQLELSEAHGKITRLPL